MVNKKMSFHFTLEPFTVAGVVGGEVHLRMVTPGSSETIHGREGFNQLIDKLERLGEWCSLINGYQGDWNFKLDAGDEVKSDGVPVQDLA